MPGLQYAEHSGKGHVKAADGCSQPESTPSLLFVAAGDTGKVDVIEIKTGGILKTLNTPGVTCLAQYWRQECLALRWWPRLPPLGVVAIGRGPDQLKRR